MKTRRNNPEKAMEQGFIHLRKAREYFERGVSLYDKRNDDSKADKENSENTKNAIKLLNEAYDEVSAIWENDIIN